MNKIGIVNVVDSWLKRDKRVSDKDAHVFLEELRNHLTKSGFETFELTMLDLLQSKKGRHIQLTITEAKEESRSGQVLNYSVPVTTVQVWIEDDAVPHKHLEKIALNVYTAYSAKSVKAIVADLMPLVCARLGK